MPVDALRMKNRSSASVCKTKTSKMEFHDGLSFALINNIPYEYHSSDLRNFFSQFIESGGFECFHFRHRPETKSVPQNMELQNESTKTSVDVERTACCVVKLKSGKLLQFLKMYNRKHWVDSSGEIMRQVCYISKVKVPTEQGK